MSWNFRRKINQGVPSAPLPIFSKTWVQIAKQSLLGLSHAQIHKPQVTCQSPAQKQLTRSYPPSITPRPRVENGRRLIMWTAPTVPDQRRRINPQPPKEITRGSIHGLNKLTLALVKSLPVPITTNLCTPYGPRLLSS